MREWIKELTPEQLPEAQRHLARTIGVEAAVRLMEAYGGTNYYIPKADAVLRDVRNKAIRDEYNGYNAKHLAIRYALSQQQIGNILREQGIEDGQISLFEAAT